MWYIIMIDPDASIVSTWVLTAEPSGGFHAKYMEESAFGRTDRRVGHIANEDAPGGSVPQLHDDPDVGRRAVRGFDAEDLGCGTATVERVRRLYKTMGIPGLTPIKPPGRPSRLSEALREPVLEAVQTDPRTLDYGFTTWSVARLTEHLRRRCRLRASPSTVRRVLAREQFSLQRPKHTLEGKRDEKAHAKAKKELGGLKKKRSARTQPKRSSSKTNPKSTRQGRLILRGGVGR